MTRKNLMLVRHGHTVWNDTGGVAGRTDIALSEHGRQCVRQLAQSLPENLNVDRWYSSPLQRTRDTSTLLRQRFAGCDAPQATPSLSVVHKPLLPDVQLDQRLVELNFGQWEGMTWVEVHEQYEQELQRWGRDWVHRAPPAGETFAQQVERCNHWLQECFMSGAGNSATVPSQQLDQQSVLAVTHGGSIRALLCLCLGWPLVDAMRLKVDPATITVLQHDGRSRSWQLRMLNSQSA